MLFRSNSSQVLKCSTSSNSCMGGSNGTITCAPGYYGPYCSICQDGFAPSTLGGETCEPCGEIKNILITLLFCLLFLGFLYWKCCYSRYQYGFTEKFGDGEEAKDIKFHFKTVGNMKFAIGRNERLGATMITNKLKFVISYLQYINFLPKLLSIPFPPFLEKFLSFFSFLNLQLDGLFQFKCLFPAKVTSYFGYFLIATLLPFLLIGVPFLYGQIRYYHDYLSDSYYIRGSRSTLGQRRGDPFRKVRKENFSKAVHSFAILFLFLFFFHCGGFEGLR